MEKTEGKERWGNLERKGIIQQKLNWLETEWREENRSREDEERTFGYIEIWEVGCQGMGWGSPADVGCKEIEGTYLLLAWSVKRVTAVLSLLFEPGSQHFKIFDIKTLPAYFHHVTSVSTVMLLGGNGDVFEI